MGVTFQYVSYGALDIKFNTATCEDVSYGPEKLTLSRSSTWAMVRKNVQKDKASFCKNSKLILTHTHAIKINVIHDILAWRREHQPEPALGRGRVCASKVPAIPRTDFWKLFANAFYFILHRGPGPWAFPLGLVGSLLRASTFLGTFQYVPRLRPKPANKCWHTCKIIAFHLHVRGRELWFFNKTIVLKQNHVRVRSG